MTFDVEQLDRVLLLGSAVLLVAIMAVRYTPAPAGSGGA